MVDPSAYVAVMAADEVAEGELYGFEIDDEDRVLTRYEGEIYAFNGICTHEYAELVEGEVDDGAIWCPLHGSGFDLRTGAVINLPAVVPLDVYDVRVEDGQVYVSREPKNSR